ncbi:MAG: acetolactate synthase [Burkholderiales bacterium]|nr:acetolactate synthase [Burkholderiales bacterium]
MGSAEKLSTGQAIARSLVRNGIDTIFGIPGAHTYDFIDALYECRDQIRFIVTRHEQGAGYMAYGYAKSTGRVGAFTVVPGPGVLNAGAALCTAYGANAPVLCITGNIQSYNIGRGRGILHELPDQLATLRGLTKWSERINHPTEAPGVMGEAFRQLRSGRTRPVAVETPWDVFGAKALVDLDVRMDVAPPPEPDPDAIARAVALLREAKNPMITVGSGAIAARAEVQQLAQLLQAPVTSHRSGRGIVGEDTPYGFSCGAGYKPWLATDVLLGIGSRLELQYLRWMKIPAGLKVIRIDIDATEMSRLKPDVGIVTDARLGTRALLDALSSTLPRRPSREEEFAGLKAQFRQEIQKVQPQMGYLDAIREVLPRDGFFVEEISQVGFTSRFGFPVYEPRTFVTGGYQDNVGFGFMSALGVKIANPDKPVVSITGDGGFMFGVQELATAVQYGINLVTVVFNNSSYGNVLRDQRNVYKGREIGSSLTNPDFVKLAESFGAAAYLAKTPAELKAALERGFAQSGPVLIEVPTERGSETSPWPYLHPNL